MHGVEQDTFFANGKTLVGDPYHFQGSNEFENGVIVSATLVGVFERVHLPDGGVFVVARATRAMFDVFCAALS